jgi:hypothetical protein
VRSPNFKSWSNIEIARPAIERGSTIVPFWRTMSHETMIYLPASKTHSAGCQNGDYGAKLLWVIEPPLLQDPDPNVRLRLSSRQAPQGAPRG